MVSPAMTDPAVAFLLFQVAQERNFIHDDLVPALAAELTRRGVANTLFETTLPAIDDASAGDLSAVDALADRVRGGFTVCAYTRLWSEAVFNRLREKLPGVTWVYLGDPRVAFAGTDHAIATTQASSLEAIARAAAEGRPVDPAALALAPTELTKLHGQSTLVRVAVGKERRPDRPAVVHGSPGCAYGQDVRDNPHFAGVPFPEGSRVVLKGCSFCATGGVPRRPAGETLRSVLEQLDNILATEPETAKIQLNDQNPFPYLVQFVERAGERSQRPLEILIETRADWLLGSLGVMERALAAAERHGHRVLLFLMGLENLSQKELDLYNKGVTVEQNERAVLECRRLRQRYPKGYSDTRAAFGFVLYNPWTEPSDLLHNIESAERIGLEEFRGQVARSKLRLYPDTALYYKALHEGLVSERFAYDAMDSARRYGYEAEVPWRFKHLATDRIYGAHDVLYRALGKHDELKVLREVVRWVDRHPERLSEPPSAIAKAVVQSLGARVRQLRHDAPAQRPTQRQQPRASAPEVSVGPPAAGDREGWSRVASLAREAADPVSALRAAGLEPDGDLTPSALAPDPLKVDVPRLEVLAFERGIKPALYLTVPRDEAPRWTERFADRAVARVDYVLAHDTVTDVRRRENAPEGEGTHVDLFFARDPADAERAREIYRDPRGPSARLDEMGALLGYPPCCVAAFAALDDRSNNSALRYASREGTLRARQRFAPTLNNLFAHVLPWFPCGYGCARSVTAAEAVLDAFASDRPDDAAALRARLARPVLYVDHARLVAFDGARLDGDVLRFTSVVGGLAATRDDPSAAAVSARFEEAVGGFFDGADGVRVNDDGVEAFAGGRPLRRLRRRAPGLGWLFPFGV